MKSALLFDLSPGQFVANQFSLFDMGMEFQNGLLNATSVFNLEAEVPKQIAKYNFRFSIWMRKFQIE